MKKAQSKTAKKTKATKVTTKVSKLRPHEPVVMAAPAASHEPARHHETKTHHHHHPRKANVGNFPYAFAVLAVILAALGGYFVGTRHTPGTISANDLREEGVRDPSTAIPAADGAKPDYSEPGLERFSDKVVVTKDFWKNFLDTDGAESFFRNTETEPSLSDGEAQGIKITQLDSTSFLSKIGLQNGDVLEAVNDVPFTDSQSILEDLRSKRDQTKIIFHTLRNGKTLDTVVEIQ